MANELIDKLKDAPDMKLPVSAITTRPELQARPSGMRNPKEEARNDQELAMSMKSIGQLQPGIVEHTPGTDEYLLLAGHRRLISITLNNAEKGHNEPEDFFWVKVIEGPLTPQERLRIAGVENIQREDMNGIETAHYMLRVKKENGWDADKGWAAKVAEYLGVSRATVTEGVKLVSLPAEVQKMVVDGELTVNGALKLAKEVKPEQQAEVARDAKKQAEEDAAKNKAKKQAQGKQGATGGKGGTKAGTATAKNVVAAARKKAALEGPKPMTRSDLLDVIRSVAESPAYGGSDGVLRVWASYFVDKFAPGTGSERTQYAKLDAVFEALPKSAQGTVEKDSKSKGAGKAA